MHREYDKYNQGDIHWQWYHNTPAYFQLVNESLLRFKGAERGSVVDVGCGDALPLSFLSEWGYDCFGVDPSYEAIDLAMKHNVSAEFFVETGEKFATRGMETDYLYSLNTIEHMDDPAAMVEIMRRVRKWGIIVTDNRNASKDISPYHEREFTPEQFHELFKEFNVERLQLPGLCSSFMAFKIWKKQ